MLGVGKKKENERKSVCPSDSRVASWVARGSRGSLAEQTVRGRTHLKLIDKQIVCALMSARHIYIYIYI